MSWALPAAPCALRRVSFAPSWTGASSSCQNPVVMSGPLRILHELHRQLADMGATNRQCRTTKDRWSSACTYQDSDSEVESTDRDQAKSGEADVADTVCLACKDGRYSEINHILLCDGCFENGEPCPSALHQACLRPFQSVPLGDWLCPDCVSDVAAGLWRGGDNSGARRESRTGPCFQASLPELLRTPATSSASSSSPWMRRSCRSSGGRPAPVSVSTSTF
mmetsp:Transcript_18300/g.59908  ORF Transcript_18300/g.59908 Transcript_18300/m.59908 type:complete len:222 (-) Transcript_18300:434-1099(-)